MSEPQWFKSSYSEASGNACVELATWGDGSAAVRDSVFPARVIPVRRAALAAFVAGVRGDLYAAGSPSA
ncbi:DUF397 domain-containing protein [Streptomyces sp. NPDC048623]|uniref:DUF397 domain-containing protein n=1 Tax=Streptomyces sp. NPDC048623 TaxID=3155761 RepID=UPI00341F8079